MQNLIVFQLRTLSIPWRKEEMKVMPFEREPNITYSGWGEVGLSPISELLI